MPTPLRHWLSKIPHPDTVRGETPAGEERSVKIGVQRSKWKDAEESLADCAKLEALDKDGNVLRVFVVEGLVLPTKAANSELVEMSKLLKDAFREGAQTSREAYGELVLLVKLMSERLAGLERAWHRLIMSLGKNAAAPSDEQSADDMIKQIVVASMVQKMNGGAVETEGQADDS